MSTPVQELSGALLNQVPLSSHGMPQTLSHSNSQYLVVALFLTVGLPGILLWPIFGQLTAEVFLAILILEYAAYRLSRLAFRPGQSYVEIVFWTFVYCWLGLSGAAQCLAGRFPWPNVVQTSDNLVFTEIVIIAGLASHEVSLWFSRKKLHRSSALFAVPTTLRMYSLSILCLALSTWGIYQQGGVAAVTVPRYQVGEALISSSQDSLALKRELLTASALQHTPPWIALLVSVYLFRTRSRRGGASLLSVLLLLVLVAFNGVANYPPSLARVQSGAILISLAVAWIGPNLVKKRLFLLGLVITLTVIFPYTDYFRTPIYDDLEFNPHPVDTMIDKGDYDAFQMTSNTVASVSEQGFDYGYHLLGSILFFVPREVWPSKPNGTGADTGEAIGYTFLNLSSPMWAEFYNAGGIFAVIIGFAVYARWCGWAERVANGDGPALLVTAYLSGFEVFMLRGDLMNTFAYFGPGLLLLLVFIVKTDQLAYEPAVTLSLN